SSCGARDMLGPFSGSESSTPGPDRPDRPHSLPPEGRGEAQKARDKEADSDRVRTRAEPAALPGRRTTDPGRCGPPTSYHSRPAPAGRAALPLAVSPPWRSPTPGWAPAAAAAAGAPGRRGKRQVE